MKIKRFSIIITLALCLTIGSVYATWSYAENSVSDQTGTTTLTITGATSDTPKGVLAVDTSGLTMEIVNGGNYVTELEITGSVTVTFTPDANTDASVLPNTFTWSISATDAALAKTHGSDKIINSVDSTAQNLSMVNNTATIDASAIAALIELNGITLETLAEHGEYTSVIAAMDAFTITVSAN